MTTHYVTLTSPEGFQEFFLDERAARKVLRVLEDAAFDSAVRRLNQSFLTPWGDTFRLKDMCPASDSGKVIGACRCPQCVEMRGLAREQTRKVKA